MEEAPASLVYWDKHRIPVNLTVIFALAVAVFGLYSMFQGTGESAIRPEFIVILGVGTALYSWLTNPRTYLVYSDAVYILYGKPRIKRIGFDNVSHLEMRQLNTPDRLRVWPVQGRRVVVMARDPEAFHDQLQQALDDYRESHPWVYDAEEPPQEMLLPPDDLPPDDLPPDDLPPDDAGGDPPRNPGANGT